MWATCLLCYVAKWPNLKLKTLYKQVLVSFTLNVTKIVSNYIRAMRLLCVVAKWFDLKVENLAKLVFETIFLKLHILEH
jgi:uncharacterized protein (DUF1501 family)